MKHHEFEALSQKEQLDFIKTQNPKVMRSRAVTKTDKEIFGTHFYTYRLDNGWGWLKARTREELEQKFNSLMA